MKHIFHQEKLKRINVLDSRFYTEDDKNYYPGSTTILGDVYPKGYGYEEWLKTNGAEADMIARRAMDKGSKVHQATEDLDNGIELTWLNEDGSGKFELDEWEMLLKYKEFRDRTSGELIANEHAYVSSTLGFGGTIDRVFKIAGKVYLLDIKTSRALRKTYELQQASYAKLWNEKNPSILIEGTGIIWLRASTRTAKIDIEKEIYQGEGWQVKLYDRHYEDAFKIFLHVQAIWKEENPDYKPANLIYPDSIKL